ncbi:hypothetical protein VSS37_07680 [Candidatus Thiothrix sp. Deng01]|uniref:Flagellar assembly protein H n=1 Tax=Candidatus Thiothrix phosphatis TaxID=3112415 RepID=A0ABU6CXL2_9GAMM|nr:hypothetical protein [Candidatus Thiothrix sp. Deng01]MEB4590854.1 hypothetical protein [Candidatus Thiothrix sp. Deng01]
MGSVFLVAIVACFVAWAAYKLGFSKGWAKGYERGEQAGFVAGREDGMKAGIREHMISTLAEIPEAPGIHAELHQQARDEILKQLNTKPAAKPSPPPKTGFLLMIWQEFGGWLLLLLFALLLVYLFR